MSDNMQPTDEVLDDEVLDEVEDTDSLDEVEEFDPFEGCLLYTSDAADEL